MSHPMKDAFDLKTYARLLACIFISEGIVTREDYYVGPYQTRDIALARFPELAKHAQHAYGESVFLDHLTTEIMQEVSAFFSLPYRLGQSFAVIDALTFKATTEMPPRVCAALAKGKITVGLSVPAYAHLQTVFAHRYPEVTFAKVTPGLASQWLSVAAEGYQAQRQSDAAAHLPQEKP